MIKRAKFICLDCEIDTGKSGDFYMLHDSVWLSVVPESLGMLCVRCVESRLGRELRPEDFNDSYINDRKWIGTRNALLTQRMFG